MDNDVADKMHENRNRRILDQVNTINALVAECHGMSVRHGFHEGQPNLGEKIALIHSELSEALESMRQGVPFRQDDHCPSHDNVSVELADAVIRIFDLAGLLDINLGAALVDKMAYNETRPYKHGKQF